MIVTEKHKKENNTMIKFIMVAMLVVGCGSSSATEHVASKSEPGSQWAPCGFKGDIDQGPCNDGLTCYLGICSFECGEKYNDVGVYAYDVASADRCSVLNGRCEQLSTVQINVCQQ